MLLRMGEETLDEIVHNRLLNSGLELLKSLRSERLANELADLALQIASGKYLDVKIVSGDQALYGSGLQPQEPIHLVYGKENKEHHDYKEKSFLMVAPQMTIVNSGEPMCFPLNNKILDYNFNSVPKRAEVVEEGDGLSF